MTFYATQRSTQQTAQAPCIPSLLRLTATWEAKGVALELDGVLLRSTLEDLRKAPKMEPIDRTPLKLWTGMIEVTPRPTVKTTAGGKFSPQAKDYHRYKDEIKRQAKAQGFDRSWIIESIEYWFFMPLPANCFKDGILTIEGLKRAGQPHEMKPDTQNLQKPILDALSSKDEHCHAEAASKRWSTNDRGYIRLSLRYRSA